MATVNMLARLLVIVGGLNWGLVALDMNLVNMLVGAWPMVEKTVYALVGIAAVSEAYHWCTCKKK